MAVARGCTFRPTARLPPHRRRRRARAHAGASVGALQGVLMEAVLTFSRPWRGRIPGARACRCHGRPWVRPTTICARPNALAASPLPSSSGECSAARGVDTWLHTTPSFQICRVAVSLPHPLLLPLFVVFFVFGSGGMLARPHARLVARRCALARDGAAASLSDGATAAPHPRVRARRRLGWPDAIALLHACPAATQWPVRACLPGSSAVACSRALADHGAAAFSSGSASSEAAPGRSSMHVQA